MPRIIVAAGAVYAFLIALYIWFLPVQFYENTPGVAMMGPFSIHFMRDVALAYLAGALILAWALRAHDRRLAIAGAVWFVLHGLFHIQIWLMRGVPFDIITASDFAGVILPAALLVWAASRFPRAAT